SSSVPCWVHGRQCFLVPCLSLLLSRLDRNGDNPLAGSATRMVGGKYGPCFTRAAACCLRPGAAQPLFASQARCIFPSTYRLLIDLRRPASVDLDTESSFRKMSALPRQVISKHRGGDKAR